MNQIIILAGGRGRRMHDDIPKVLQKLGENVTLIDLLLKSVNETKKFIKPVVVVGYQAEKVKDHLKDTVLYAYQDKQLGTGHAVACGIEELDGDCENVLVLYGDMPFLRPDTISNFIEEHKNSNNDMTMMTIKLKDYTGWHEAFYGFGRVIRDENNNISRIIEMKDADEEQKEITEVTPSYFCFKASWLKENIKKIKNNNVQNEYYLTDLVGMAINGNHNLGSLIITNPIEGYGINRQHHLQYAQQVYLKDYK